ncbi:hypothetical protein PFLUV_G00148160 [Perca fluviatilis]|uniref:Uncharacterized protein n=1 Tax=Perca fluviatilis TaxID=8168 RepID=A0A6A5EKQ7_PERFL|nr:hypothetical protein PFLUV_G00148160 [Perca fluviatilis]
MQGRSFPEAFLSLPGPRCDSLSNTACLCSGRTLLLRHSSSSPGVSMRTSSLLRLQLGPVFACYHPSLPHLPLSPLNPVVSSDAQGDRAQLSAAGRSERDAHSG